MYRHLLACFDRSAYRLGHELTGIQRRAVDARILQRSGHRDLDLAVFADGVGSTARSALLPDVRPQYAGYVAWRGWSPRPS